MNTKCKWYRASVNAPRILMLATAVLFVSCAGLTSGESRAADAPASTATPTPVTSNSSNALSGVYHLYYYVTGYVDPDDTSKHVYCSPPAAQVNVSSDDGTTLTLSIDNAKESSHDSKPATCDDWVTKFSTYTIKKSSLLAASPTIQGFVAGVLAVPFKFHLSDHSTTAGSTIGGYAGYRTSVTNQFAITPVIGGGLALVSTAAAQASTSTTSSTTPSATPTSGTSSQTSTGFSITAGIIGSVTASATKGTQYGILIGWDWVGAKANYAYEGKPWISFEIGYNFAL